MEEACRALDPFRPLGLAEFAAFLARAEEYSRTGLVRVPGAGDLRAEELLAAAARLGSAGDADLATAQAEVARTVNALAREAGLKGTITPDPKWAQAQIARARVAPHLHAIRNLAGRITSPEAYADEAVRQETSRLEAVLDRDTLPVVGAEFGVPASARATTAKVLAAVLVKVSGHAPAKPKRGGKAPAAPLDPAVVEEHARRLAALVERSADPDALSEPEVEDEIARLEALPKPVLFEVVSRAGIDGVKRTDGVAAMTTRVRNRLTATRRARERAEV